MQKVVPVKKTVFHPICLIFGETAYACQKKKGVPAGIKTERLKNIWLNQHPSGTGCFLKSTYRRISDEFKPA